MSKILERAESLQGFLKTRNPSFARCVEVIREEYVAKGVQRGKALLRSLLRRVTEGELKSLRCTMNSSLSVLEFFARFTVYDLAMKEIVLSQTLDRPPFFFFTRTANPSSNFISRIAALKRDYNTLSNIERAAARHCFLTCSPFTSAPSPLLSGVLGEAEGLQLSLTTCNPSFAATAEALREEILALAGKL